MTSLDCSRIVGFVRSVILGGVLGGGCELANQGSGSPPADKDWRSFSELTNPRVLVQLEQDEVDYFAQMRLTAIIESDDPVGDGGTCPTLVDLRAFLGDEELLARGRGGWRTTESGERQCERPTLWMTFDEGARLGDRVLHVGNELSRISIPIGDGLTRRQAYLAAPPLRGYGVGEVVTVRWLSATDLDTQLPTFEVVTAAGTAVVSIPPSALTRSGDALSFVVPPSLAGLGVGRLRLAHVTSVAGCGGACVVRASYLTGLWLQIRAG